MTIDEDGKKDRLINLRCLKAYCLWPHSHKRYAELRLQYQYVYQSSCYALRLSWIPSQDISTSPPCSALPFTCSVAWFYGETYYLGSIFSVNFHFGWSYGVKNQSSVCWRLFRVWKQCQIGLIVCQNTLLAWQWLESSLYPRFSQDGILDIFHREGFGRPWIQNRFGFVLKPCLISYFHCSNNVIYPRDSTIKSLSAVILQSSKWSCSWYEKFPLHLCVHCAFREFSEQGRYTICNGLS